MGELGLLAVVVRAYRPLPFGDRTFFDSRFTHAAFVRFGTALRGSPHRCYLRLELAGDIHGPCPEALMIGTKPEGTTTRPDLPAFCGPL